MKKVHSFAVQLINVPKRKDLLEADGNRDVEGLSLAQRRYYIYVKYVLTDHYYCIHLLLRRVARSHLSQN